jgi:hypothetical protein
LCEGQADAPPPDCEHNERPLIGDEMYPVLLAEAVREGHLTDAEAEQQYALHKLVAAAQAYGWPLEEGESDSEARLASTGRPVSATIVDYLEEAAVTTGSQRLPLSDPTRMA